jgi:hypothetical protein
MTDPTRPAGDSPGGVPAADASDDPELDTSGVPANDASDDLTLDADLATDDSDLDTSGAPADSAELDPDVRNDDLSPVRRGPDVPVPTSDPDPDAIDAAFPGRPLTDAEIDALAADDDRP